MQFEIVFDVSQAKYFHQAELPLWGLAMVAISSFLVFSPAWARASRNDHKTRRFCWVFLILSAVWTFFVFVTTLKDYISARRALTSGQHSVVEGVVTDFKPMPFTGHASESFRVGDQTFSYSDYQSTAGVNHTRSHGGPIAEGIYVRVTFTENLILRLEIAR